MQAKKKLKKKAAVKSTPAKSKKEKQAKEEQQNEKQPFLKTLILEKRNPISQSWKRAPPPFWIFCLRPPWTPKAVTIS